MQYWLMKSEPDEVSIDDVMSAKDRTVPWFGVRNYQARNFMRDAMQVGDGVLFYHSSCPEPGIAGIAEVVSGPYPDATQFDPKSHYYDAKATPEQPRWISVDVKGVRKTRLLSLAETPPMDITVVDSGEAPGGIGEEAVGPLAPAVANALFAATGKRVSELPFSRAGFTLA